VKLNLTNAGEISIMELLSSKSTLPNNEIPNIVSFNEKRILSCLQVLPSEPLKFTELMEYLGVNPDNDVEFFDALHELKTKNWIISADDTFTMPEKKQIEIAKIKPANYEDCMYLVSFLVKKLETSIIDSPEYNKYFRYAESLITKVQANHVKFVVLTNFVASYYIDHGDYAKAVNYNALAISIAERINDPHLAVYYKRITEILKNQKKYDKALKYALKLADLILSKGEQYVDYIELAWVYRTIALLYYETIDFANAKVYIDKVIEINQLPITNELFRADVRLQRSIHLAYSISRHLQKYIKLYFVLLSVFIVFMVTYILFR